MNAAEWAELGITPTAADLADGDAVFTGSITAGSNVLTVNALTSGTVRVNKTLAEGYGIPRNLVISGGSGSAFTLQSNSPITLSNVPMVAMGVLAASVRADGLHPNGTQGDRILGLRGARRAQQMGWFA